MPLDALANIAAMTKLCTQKAAGICGDDVAVNTKQLMDLERGRGVSATLKVIRGSLLNKAALIPIALTVSAFVPWAVLPLLAVGGLHLASEGARNLMGKGHGHGHGHEGHSHDGKESEKDKIRGALTVDFILSAEITVLTLSMIAGIPLMTQLAVLAGTGAAMTLGMYGLIGGLINMDPVAHWLQERKGNSIVSKTARQIGKGMGKTMPFIMKGISVAGTVALFVIGGELLLHGVPGAEHLVTGAMGSLAANPIVQGGLSLLADTAIGLAAGFLAMPVMDKLEPKFEKAVEKVKSFSLKIKLTKPAAAKSAPQPAPVPQASANALKNAPLAPVLNTAAQKSANDDKPVAPVQKPTAPKP